MYILSLSGKRKIMVFLKRLYGVDYDGIVVFSVTIIWIEFELFDEI